MQIKSKVPYIGEHIFSYMSALSNKHGAINLSQGFPNFEPDALLKQLLVETAQDQGLPLVHQYGAMPGMTMLQHQIGWLTQDTLEVTLDTAAEVTITVGATEAIFDAMAAFVWPGDEVIMMDPSYDCYRPAVDAVGGKAIFYPLQAPTFTIDWDAFGALITEQTKMIILNSPHNPTGSILSKEDLDALARLVDNTDILVLSDEVYGLMVFDGSRHVSPLQHPHLRERTIAVYSFGKSYHITGWRLGYAIAAPALTHELRKMHQNNVFSVAHPLQKAIALYMEQKKAHLQLSHFYQQKRDLLLEVTKGSRLKPLPCHGAYFQLFDYSDVSQMDDMAFCHWLVEEIGVAAIPVSRLYAQPQEGHLIRLCFAKTDEVLIAAGNRLSGL